MNSVFRRSLAITALILAAPCASFAAQGTNGAIPMLSGGVGDEDYDTLQSYKHQYNTKMLFTENNGAYLSDVKVSIVQDGGEIANTVTDGPVLYVRLAPGSYTVKANAEGLAKQVKFKVPKEGVANVHVTFPLNDQR